ATDAAAIENRGGRLAIVLPSAGGQVCFYRGAAPEQSQAIHCLGYGSVAGPVLSGMQIGAAPADGMSLQRCSGTVARVGTPTPGAITPASLCAGSGPGLGPAPAPGLGSGPLTSPDPGALAGADTRAPLLRITIRRSQDVDRLRLTIRSDEDAVVTTSGSIRPRPGSRLPNPPALRAVEHRAVAGRARSVRLRLSSARLRRAKNALRRGQRLRARITIVARDRSGNTRRVQRWINLRDD
ncbi:MAG: hypothetical protein ACRDMZ_22060, partial [Solirubrobacteraceae bacterium]